MNTLTAEIIIGIKKNYFKKTVPLHEPHFDDKDFKISKFTADSTMKIIEKTEIRLDNKGRHLVVTDLDGNGGLMGKKIYSYDENDQIVQITRYDMIHRKNENSEIPVTVMTYEYE